MKIDFNNLKYQWDSIKNRTLNEMDEMFTNSSYILGKQVKDFEKKFCDWNQSKYSIGVSNGTDALEIASRALDLNGKIAVFLPSNTFIATFIGVYKVYPNASYYLVDCDDNYLMDINILESLIEDVNNKYDNILVVPVHLYGATVDMKRLKELANRFNLWLLEDCSQAHGAVSNSGNKVGNDSHVSAFSLYPGKNLGAAGDAGIITTNDNLLNDKILKLRNLGSVIKYNHEIFSGNHRLDTIQAIVLKNKLEFFDKWTNHRIEIANNFTNNINNDKIILPQIPLYCEKHVYHIYCVRVKDRSDFMKYLMEKDIPTLIHYPIPFFKSKALNSIEFKNSSYKNALDFANQIVSLPIHPFITKNQSDYIINTINTY